MMRSLYSAVSGMSGSMLRLDVIGNNIANIQTNGFKSGRLDFAEQLAQTYRAGGAPNGDRGGTDPIQIGTGVRIASASQLYTQGSLTQTGVSTDCAIEGQGLFVLRDGGQQRYTRDGSFRIDSSGNLTGASGRCFVQGFGYDRASGTYGSTLQDLAIPLNAIDPAQATSKLSLSGNLAADSAPRGSLLKTTVLHNEEGAAATQATLLTSLRASVGDEALLQEGDTLHLEAVAAGQTLTSDLAVTAGATIGDLANALNGLLAQADVSGLTASLGSDGRLTAVSPDALGLAGALSSIVLSAESTAGEERAAAASALGFSTIESARDAGCFTEEATVFDTLGRAHELRFTFTRVPGDLEFTWTAEATDDAEAVLSGNSGRIRFAADGSLQSIEYDGADGRASSALELVPGDGSGGPLTIALDGGTPGAFTGLTAVAGETTVAGQANGCTAGEMIDLQIDTNGCLLALFSNGQTRPLGRIAVAEFIHPAGLTRAEANTYVAGANSGTPRIAAVGEGIASTLVSGALEQSNVDLAREFTDMIVAQRGFQANARVITTSDQVLSELIDIKR